MDFAFDFPVTVTGRTVFEPKQVATIEDCIAVIDHDQYDHDDWAIYELLVDGVVIPQRHYLQDQMRIYLTTPDMMRRIDHKWNERLLEDLWETAS